ncbi:hypothetical protein Airi01_003580 [Actinoallomurus iriomotensis]|uniref:Uncharacterized protein n=1 Tax=Actinoallomurus iriomotensis TaxID=478107 RepID=A0A9W6RA43_9ACTN|nr:hypothetical protein Airi01_003580 [Actinoallomurus iriomotensis]
MAQAHRLTPGDLRLRAHVGPRLRVPADSALAAAGRALSPGGSHCGRPLISAFRKAERKVAQRNVFHNTSKAEDEFPRDGRMRHMGRIA